MRSWPWATIVVVGIWTGQFHEFLGFNNIAVLNSCLCGVVAILRIDEGRSSFSCVVEEYISFFVFPMMSLMISADFSVAPAWTMKLEQVSAWIGSRHQNRQHFNLVEGLGTG